MTTVASSAAIRTPPLVSKANGSIAIMVVNAVINIGRSRVCPPRIKASYGLIPALRLCSITSISTTALVKTIPMSIRVPMSPAMPKVCPVASNPTNAPMEARGRLTITISGLRKERKVTTRTASASNTAIPMALNMFWKVSVISSAIPPMLTSTPSGSVRESISDWMARLTMPIFSWVTVAVTVAAIFWSMRLMLVTCAPDSMLAISSRATDAGAPTGSFSITSRLVVSVIIPSINISYGVPSRFTWATAPPRIRR